MPRVFPGDHASTQSGPPAAAAVDIADRALLPSGP